MALRSWRGRRRLVFQEINDEKKMKRLTITEDGLISRANDKLVVSARFTGQDASHVIRDDLHRAI